MSSYIEWPDIPSRRNPAHAAAHAGGSLFHGAVAAALVALFAPLGVLFHPAVRRFFLAIAVLNISLPLGIHIGNRQYAAEYGSLAGFNISLTTIALVALYLPLLVRKMAVPLSASPPRSKASLALILYILFCLASALVASDVTLALYEVFLLLQLGLLYWYIVRTVTSHRDLFFLVRVLVVGLAIQGLIMMALAAGIAQLGVFDSWVRVTDDSLASGLITREIGFAGLRARVDEVVTMGLIRLGGLIGSPNDAAAYLSMTLAIAVGAMAVPLGKWYRRLALVGIVLGGAALIFTLSRGGWVALGLSLAVLAWFGLLGSLVRRVPRKVRLVVALALVLCSVSLYSVIGFRLTMDDRGSAQSRMPLNQIAFLMIEDHPLLGVGANNFPVAMQSYVTRGFFGEFLYTVHNRYLLIWSETGFGALAAFLWFLLAALYAGGRTWRRQDPLVSPLALACTAALGGHLFHMFWEPFRGQSILQLVFVLAALLAAMERISSDRRLTDVWRPNLRRSARQLAG
jgi:O-antigen ligase